MYSPSLNLSNNSNEMLLKSVEAGNGISYTFIKNFNGKLRREFDIFQNVCYDDLKDTVRKDYARVSDYFSKIKDCEISRHEILTANVKKTTFSNGVAVYVNYGESDYQTQFGVLKANSFIYGEQ